LAREDGLFFGISLAGMASFPPNISNHPNGPFPLSRFPPDAMASLPHPSRCWPVLQGPCSIRHVRRPFFGLRRLFLRPSKLLVTAGAFSPSRTIFPSSRPFLFFSFFVILFFFPLTSLPHGPRLWRRCERELPSRSGNHFSSEAPLAPNPIYSFFSLPRASSPSEGFSPLLIIPVFLFLSQPRRPTPLD